MTILDQLAEHARERVAEAKKKRPLERIRQQALSVPKGNFAFENVLKKPGISFICECKMVSRKRRISERDHRLRLHPLSA